MHVLRFGALPYPVEQEKVEKERHGTRRNTDRGHNGSADITGKALDTATGVDAALIHVTHGWYTFFYYLMLKASIVLAFSQIGHRRQ
jgi:hypothetical protein